MTILGKLMEKNEFPILFIGSGISKRYLIDFQSWDGLLEKFWLQVEGSLDFYGQLNILRDDLKRENGSLNEKEIEFYSNLKMSSMIEEKFNRKFNEGRIQIEGFSTRDVYSTGISPFKMGISNALKEYKIRSEKLDEANLFKRAITKSQIMISTNYDTFIEDCYNAASQYGIKTYIGQSGFFEQTIGYAELYKIHGSITKPKSIVISGDDYELFNANSILISAKIISMLIHSPIIFLGYSLTDLNVRKFIKDFASSLSSEDPVSLEERLIIVDWKENEEGLIEEVTYDPELNCKFTVIKTDNYSLIYEYLHKIDQGVAPSEIRKYQHIIKQLVIDTGKEGALKSVLLSPIELEQVEQMISQGGTLTEKIVVALGDSRVIFKIPNKLTFLEDYIFDKNELTTDVILRFLANENATGRYPFLKYVSIEKINNSNLHDYEKEKLRQRLVNHGSLRKQIQSIPDGYKNIVNDIEQILNKNYKMDREYNLIAYNIERLDFEKVEGYVKEKVKELVDAGEGKINTNFRRLLLIYDHVKNKRETTPNH
jgi:hypothetical protein